MRVVATKSLVIWTRVCWSKGCFFDHWRSDMTFSLVTGGATRRAVRKHRAPKGALRHVVSIMEHRHIERVRKHRAPKGALRLKRARILARPINQVRKHRAPKGALRPLDFRVLCESVPDGQKAPSAIRCIKTLLRRVHHAYLRAFSQKAPSAIRCIKTDPPRGYLQSGNPKSESIGCHKVH